MNTAISIIAGFLSGIIGSMGFGGGGVLIIYLAVFMNIPQLKAQGINLLFFIPCATLAIIIYSIKRQIKYRMIYPVIIGGMLGATLASFILKFIKTKYLSMIFGAFLITMGFVSIIKILKRKNAVD